MKKLLKNEHLQSFIHTFFTDLLWEASVGTAAAHIFLQQDFSKAALMALGYSVFRTFIRIVRETYFPKPKVLTPVDLASMNP